MDARTPNIEETRFLPAVAQAIAEWFGPMLENPDGTARVVAVSDVDITMENVPTLPLVLVAFTQSLGEQLLRSSSEEFKITDTFVVDFWLKPDRIKSKVTGKETPYWNYYPYEFIRNRLINGFLNFTGPNGEHVAYRGMRVEADPLAARLTFTFIATFQWCLSDVPVEMDLISEIGFRLCTPASCIPEPECPEQDDEQCDPCK